MSSEPGRSTVNRVAAVLDAFTSEHPAPNLSQIARLSGLPVATTHRLLAELVDAGMLQRRSDARYQIGLKLWQAGTLAPAYRDLRTVALPFMEDLYAATGQNVQLAVRAGTRALFLEKLSGSGSVSSLTQLAGKLPLHATGVGKVILAFSEPALLEQIIEEGLSRYTPRTVTDARVLRKNIRQVRTMRLGYVREEMTTGTASVAAPIFNAAGHLEGAISLVVPISTSLPHLAGAIRTAANGITRQLTRPEPFVSVEWKAAVDRTP